MSPNKLNEYRKRVEDALRMDGYPVDAWKAAAEKDLLENPRPRPATRIIPGYTQGVKMVRPGYAEYRAHGRHAGVLVPRCLAKAQHGSHCGSIAMRDSYHCSRHGGRRPGQHRKGTNHHWFQGKNESRAQRQYRKKSHEELKRIEVLAIQQGVMDVNIDMRGPRPGTSWEAYTRGREQRLRAKRLMIGKGQPA